jgi:hypothetical protein
MGFTCCPGRIQAFHVIPNQSFIILKNLCDKKAQVFFAS